MGAPFAKTSDTLETNWDSILEALGIMVVAGGRVFKERVDKFAEEAMALKDHICPDIFMTERMLLDWFFNNREILTQRCADLTEAPMQHKFSSELRQSVYFDNILRSMRRIAEMDKEGLKQAVQLMDVIRNNTNKRELIAF